MRELPDVTKVESLGELAPAQRARAQFLSGPPYPWGAIEVRNGHQASSGFILIGADIGAPLHACAARHGPTKSITVW